MRLKCISSAEYLEQSEKTCLKNSLVLREDNKKHFLIKETISDNFAFHLEKLKLFRNNSMHLFKRDGTKGGYGTTAPH